MNKVEMKEALKEILIHFFEKPKKMGDFTDFLGEVYREMIDDEHSLEWYGKWHVKTASNKDDI